MKYDKTQYGWLIIGLFAFAITLLSVGYFNEWGKEPVSDFAYFFLTGIFILIMLLLFRLRVQFENKELKLTYGIGLITMTIRPDKVNNVETLNIPFIRGRGALMRSGGKIYNVHGTKAVRVEYVENSGKKAVIIGTSEPDKLKEFIEKQYSLNHE